MKTINHWINGKNVASKEYFTTTNPANGEVLAEVASGGQLEDQAVAAAEWDADERARAPDAPPGRADRPERAADRRTGNRRHRPADPPDQNVLIPRASHNFEFFAEVCQQMNGKTYPVDDKMLNYTLVQPVGCARWCRRGTCRS